MAARGNNTCFCLLALRVLVDPERTALLYSFLLCAKPIAFGSVCLQYANTVVKAWFVPSLRGVQKKMLKQKQKSKKRKRGEKTNQNGPGVDPEDTIFHCRQIISAENRLRGQRISESDLHKHRQYEY